DRACADPQLLWADPVYEAECRQAATHLMLDEVFAVPECEHNLVLGLCHDGLCPRTTYKGIPARSTDELVIALTTLKDVVAVVAPQEIITRFSVEGIVAQSTKELVCAVTTHELVVTVVALQEIIPGVAGHRVIARPPDELVRAVAAGELVVAVITL